MHRLKQWKAATCLKLPREQYIVCIHHHLPLFQLILKNIQKLLSRFQRNSDSDEFIFIECDVQRWINCIERRNTSKSAMMSISVWTDAKRGSICGPNGTFRRWDRGQIVKSAEIVFRKLQVICSSTHNIIVNIWIITLYSNPMRELVGVAMDVCDKAAEVCFVETPPFVCEGIRTRYRGDTLQRRNKCLPRKKENLVSSRKDNSLVNNTRYINDCEWTSARLDNIK